MRFFLFTLLFLPVISNALECDRLPREVVNDGNPIRIYLGKSKADVHLIDEQSVTGIRADVREGLVVTPSPINGKFGLSIKPNDYSSFARVDGGSGKTYLFQLLARPGCPDSLVSIVNQSDSQYRSNSLPHQTNISPGSVKGLMYYLIRGEKPNNYRRKTFEHVNDNDLRVFNQGSVSFYLQEQLVGPRYIGTTYRVINRGRTQFRLAIENINYSAPAIKQSVGIAREVSMLPTSRRLGPAPEFVSDVYTATNEGLLFIVSEKQQRHE